MKAERRHELKENSLEHWIARLPELGKLYGNYILLGVIGVLLVIILLRYRLSASADHLKVAEENLSTANSAIAQLRQLPADLPPDRLAAMRREYETGVESALDSATHATSERDRPTRAAILLAQGDLYWALANSPQIPAASTQPALAMDRSPDELLKASADAYQQIVDNFNDEDFAVTSAELGLAAIAENQGDWDKANQAYQAVLDNTKSPDPLKQIAQLRQSQLANIRQPAYLATAAPAPVEPSLQSFAPTNGTIPGVTAPGMTSPGMTSPGIGSPGLSSPGLASPGFSTPAATTEPGATTAPSASGMSEGLPGGSAGSSNIFNPVGITGSDSTPGSTPGDIGLPGGAPPSGAMANPFPTTVPSTNP
jgi:hypothetical protein